MKGAGSHGRAEKLWTVGKSEEVGFKARKKLIIRKSAVQGWEGVADECGGVVCVRSKEF